jgi:hypothetical protein
MEVCGDVEGRVGDVNSVEKCHHIREKENRKESASYSPS